jgi:lipoprotein-anchoring transpeptidase ErfK/SrfK
LGLTFLALIGTLAWFFWPKKTGSLQLAQIPQIPNAVMDALKKQLASTNDLGTPSDQPHSNGSVAIAPPRTNTILSAPRGTNAAFAAPARSESEPTGTHPVQNILEAQIALARLGISAGCIDGAMGENMRRALLAWQIHNHLPVSGEFDAETKAALSVEEPLFITYIVTEQDLGRIMKVPATWLEKSEQKRLDYESVLELVAERGRASTTFTKKINPQVNWTNTPVGTLVKIPRIDPPPREKAAFARIHLYSKTIDVFGKATNLIAHFPCSIAAKVEKRPVGALYVAKAAANPSYIFDPAVFTESEEAKKIGRKLMIPPGPNNPVGTAWIGLDRPGYGIHGTPKPEQIGHTESHGCFRLANWNADHLLQLAWVGMPVIVEP